MLDTIITKLMEDSGTARIVLPSPTSTASASKAPVEPPKIVLPKPAPKPAPKKPAKVFPADEIHEICPACGSELSKSFHAPGYCAYCGARIEKPQKVISKTKAPLPPGTFKGRATTVMPSGTALRVAKKKYKLPSAKESAYDDRSDQFELGDSVWVYEPGSTSKVQGIIIKTHADYVDVEIETADGAIDEITVPYSRIELAMESFKENGVNMKEQNDQLESVIDELVAEKSSTAATVGHLALDLIGLIPGAEAFDAANALWYAKEGKWLPAALSLISVIPAIGDLVGKGGKLAPWLAKNMPKTGKVLGKVGPDIAKRIRKVEWAIKTNSQVINQVLNTAAQDEKLAKYVPQMKDALSEFSGGAIAKSESVELSEFGPPSASTTGYDALPDSCFAKLPSTGEVIRINKGESGYTRYRHNETGEPMKVTDDELML